MRSLGGAPFHQPGDRPGGVRCNLLLAIVVWFREGDFITGLPVSFVGVLHAVHFVLLGAYVRAEVNNPDCPWGAHYDDATLAKNVASNEEEIQRAIALAQVAEQRHTV